MTRTNAYSVLCVMIRAFALWFLVRTGIAIPIWIVETSAQWHYSVAWVVLLLTLGILLPTAAALFCLIFTDKVARLSLARPQKDVFESDISITEWQRVSFSIVGLWQAFAAVVDLVSYIVRIVLMRNLSETFSTIASWPDNFTSGLIATSVQLLLGLALLFGSRGLVGLLRRFREAGYAYDETIEKLNPVAGSVAGSGSTPPA